MKQTMTINVIDLLFKPNVLVTLSALLKPEDPSTITGIALLSIGLFKESSDVRAERTYQLSYDVTDNGPELSITFDREVVDQDAAEFLNYMAQEEIPYQIS